MIINVFSNGSATFQRNEYSDFRNPANTKLIARYKMEKLEGELYDSLHNAIGDADKMLSILESSNAELIKQF